MAIDISSYYSIFNGLAGTGTQSSSFPSTSSTSFADYFLNATSATDTKKNSTNSLFTDLSSYGTSSALQSLLGGSSTDNDIVSSYLTTSATSNNSNDSTSTDTFSSFLQSNFQSQQMKMLTAAKDNLQVQATKYGESMAGNDSEAVKLRMQQMSQNISMLDQYLTQKQTEMVTKTNLMEQLKASSAYTQFLNTKSNVTL